MGVTLAYDQNTTLNPNDTAYPCGLIARSLFNDSYILLDSTLKNIAIDPNNIAWGSDKFKYKN